MSDASQTPAVARREVPEHSWRDTIMTAADGADTGAGEHVF